MIECSQWRAWYDQKPPQPPRLIVTGECRLEQGSEIELVALTPPAPVQNGLSIRGPLMASRSRSPVFQIQTGAEPFFSVEVTTDPKLFNLADHGQERTETNFYASWTQGLQRADGETSFTLPEDVWARLGESEKLAYRLVTSSQPDRWENSHTTLADGEALQAPILLPGDADIPWPEADTLVLMRHMHELPGNNGGTVPPQARFTAQVGLQFNRILLLPDRITIEIDRSIF